MDKYQLQLAGQDIKNILQSHIYNSSKMLEKIRPIIDESLKYFDLTDPQSSTYGWLKGEYWSKGKLKEDIPNVLYIPLQNGVQASFYQDHPHISTIITGPDVTIIPAGCFSGSTIETFIGFNIKLFDNECFENTELLERVYNLYDLNLCIYDPETGYITESEEEKPSKTGLRLASVHPTAFDGSSYQQKIESTWESEQIHYNDIIQLNNIGG